MKQRTTIEAKTRISRARPPTMAETIITEIGEESVGGESLLLIMGAIVSDSEEFDIDIVTGRSISVVSACASF